MDHLHKGLWQIAFYDNHEKNLTLFSTSLVPCTPADLGDNLLSLSPFKHRTFKPRADGKGMTGPQTLESMVLCNEQQLSTQPTYRAMHRSNLTPSEWSAIKELNSNVNIITRSHGSVTWWRLSS